MVLQDKYKAKASRRYQAKHGMGTGGGEESSGRGRGGGRGRGRGRGRGGGGSFMERNGFADPNKDSEEDDDEESEGDDGEDEGEDHIQSTDAQASGAGPSSPPKTSRGGKYSKRKLTSNAWRFEHPSDEEEDNPNAVPEPEIDLSRAFEKARLTHYEETQQRNGPPVSATAGDDDDDIDTDLAYLHTKAANRTNSSRHPPPASHNARHTVERPEGYEEAQRANRDLQERNDAKMKIWGKLQDDLESRKQTQRTKTAQSKDRSQKQVLEGEDFLDSMLG